MRDTQIGFAQPSGRGQLARLRAVLWQESSADEDAQELELILGGKSNNAAGGSGCTEQAMGRWQVFWKPGCARMLMDARLPIPSGM
jgi:hypothetical protein